MHKPELMAVVLVIGVLGAAAWHFTTTRSVDADDAERTTSLQVAPYDFDGSGLTQAIVAQTDSTNDDDVFAELTMFWTVPGPSPVEEAGAAAHTRREPGDASLHLSHALPTSEFASGTSIRVQFLIQDKHGNTTLTMTRATPIP